MLGGLAGVAEAFDLGVIPSSGLLIMLPTVVAAVSGGMWSFWGAVAGAFILALCQYLTTIIFGGDWIGAVPFVILIVILFLRPQGILKK